MKASVILEGLLELKRQVSSGQQDKEAGVCLNLCRIVNSSDCFAFLDAYVCLWDEYSGDVEYPVKAYSRSTPCEEYELSFDLWVGEYGEARKRLLDFLIKRLQQEVENETYQV